MTINSEHKISTPTINHFTRFDSLSSIIRCKYFEPRYCLENINHLNWSKLLGAHIEQLPKLAYPMVCFTDLPHDKWDIHKKKYGDCVISLSEEWKLRNGLIPIIYLVNGDFVSNNLLPNCLSMALKYCNEHLDQIGYKNFIHMLLPYFKPYADDTCKYYDEREWRYFPWQGLDNKDLCIAENEYDYKKEECTRNLLNDKNNLLMFNFQDIVNIEVPTEKQKNQVANILTDSYSINFTSAIQKISIPLLNNSKN